MGEVLLINADWNKGYSVGARDQRKSDIDNITEALKRLEDIPGIGEKTAWKVRKFFMGAFE